MDLERVIAALAPREVVGRAPVEVADLAYDTRAVAPGALFFCVRGATADGHELAPQAVAAGAAALVVERPVEAAVPQIFVDDSRAAMAVAADVFFGHPTHELVVVGVTGTNGKTTTAHLVYAILAAVGFTNLTPDHLDFHGTMERYFDAKRRLFVGDDPPPAAINLDDPWGRKLSADRPDALTFAVDATDAAIRPDALDGIDLKLRGRFNVSNALGALTAARLLGIDHEATARGLEAVRGVPGRFESVDEGQPFEVIVDYSHTPDSLENALRAARELATARVLCVFGCGGDRDREKRPLMGRIASELADLPILTTDNPRSEDPLAIIDEVLAGVSGEVEVEPDRREAIARAIETAREGDVVLIAGRGAEPAQEVAGRKLPFDDRDVAREALRRIQAAAGSPPPLP